MDLTSRTKLLDIGGDSGAYFIEVCKKYPKLTATVLGLPEVVQVVAKFIESFSLSDHISTLAADFNFDPFSSDINVAIMASNLPMYGREAIGRVICKSYDALVAGEEMHLIGEALNGSRDGPADPVMWGLAQTLNNSTGLAHSVDDYMQYFSSAGSINIQAKEFIPSVLKRISGIKKA